MNWVTCYLKEKNNLKLKIRKNKKDNLYICHYAVYLIKFMLKEVTSMKEIDCTILEKMYEEKKRL